MKKYAIAFLLSAGVASVCVGQESPRMMALDSMAATERVFAATSLKIGIRASFLEFFADSALAFAPEPYVFKRAVSKLPPPADPLARTLKWEPIAGDVSASGEMGYLMGPSTMTDHSQPNAPTHYGFYLSVWKKQADGSWKVIIDVGTDATEGITRFFGQKFTPLGNENITAPSTGADTAMMRFELLALDRSFSRSVAAKGLHIAYSEILDPQARAIREGSDPIIGKDSIMAHLPDMVVVDPMNAEVSLAGDLGYTYGAYKSNPNATKPSGYYVRIWKKNQARVWKLVVDKDAPAEEN
jgi:ketosteroid isomerase-like protein